MAKENPTLYSILKTTIWFAVASVLLLGCLVWMVMGNHVREWKDWQTKFVQLKTQKVKDELAKAEKAVNKKELDKLTQEHAAAEAQLKAHRATHQSLAKEIEAQNVKALKARTHFQDLKQYQDSYRYYMEEYRLHHDPRQKDYAAKLAALAPELDKAKRALEDAETTLATQEQALAALLQTEKNIQAKIDALFKERDKVKRKLDAVKPTLAKAILNAPMLDFVAPSLQIQQIVVEDLYDDYHFTKVQKIDRCTTCHLGIDQKGFENAPQPFTTHPKLDLYLGSSSPHSIEKFGCTTCHSGNGHSVSFVNAAHTPNNEEQKKEWEKKYRWESLHKWEAKMLPMKYIESSCAKCHQQVLEVPQAAKLNQGRKLARESGCLNCHKIEGFENSWKVGPALDNVASKL